MRFSNAYCRLVIELLTIIVLSELQDLEMLKIVLVVTLVLYYNQVNHYNLVLNSNCLPLYKYICPYFQFNLEKLLKEVFANDDAIVRNELALASILRLKLTTSWVYWYHKLAL